MIFERSHNIFNGIDLGMHSISTHHSTVHKGYKEGGKLDQKKLKELNSLAYGAILFLT